MEQVTEVEQGGSNDSKFELLCDIDLDATLQWAAEGKLKPVIDSIFPLDQAAAAFAKLRSRNFLGKILVEPFEPEVESD